MRFLDVPIVSFTAANGKSYQVRDRRPITVYDTAFDMDVSNRDMLDEIASRREVWGANSEGLAYAIFDNNIEKLVELNFDMSQIRTLHIPVLDE